MAINPDNFVFHTDLLPLSIPASHYGSIDTSSSLTGYQKKITPTAWVDIPGDNLAADPYFSQTLPPGNIFRYKSYLHDENMSDDFFLLVQQDGSRFRIVLVEENISSNTKTYTPRTINYEVHFVHMATPQ